MKIGFWNIAKNESTVLLDLIGYLSKDLDIFVLLECVFTTSEILLKLNSVKTTFFFSPAYIPNTFFHVFTRSSDELSKPIQESRRLVARNIITPSGWNFTLLLIHYQSKLYWNSASQDAHSHEIKQFIDQVESLVNHDRTIIIGDFNMNPFQNGMVQTTGLHATMDRKLSLKGSRTVGEKEYKFFYNPMWSFFGEKGKGLTNGTFYNYSADPVCNFWNIFDQVLIRPSILGEFNEDSLNIITEINGVNLLKVDGTIDKIVSDHLPVSFEFLSI